MFRTKAVVRTADDHYVEATAHFAKGLASLNKSADAANAEIQLRQQRVLDHQDAIKIEKDAISDRAKIRETVLKHLEHVAKIYS